MSPRQWQWNKPSVRYEEESLVESEYRIVQALLKGTAQHPIWLTLFAQDAAKRLPIFYVANLPNEHWGGPDEGGFTDIPSFSYPIRDLCASFGITDPNELAGRYCFGLSRRTHNIDQLVAIRPNLARPLPEVSQSTYFI